MNITTITAEISVLREIQRRLKPWHSRTIDDAIEKHEAAQNPLGLSWEAFGADDSYWVVSGARKEVLTRASNVTEAQARHIAAAPEMADALVALRDNVKYLGRGPENGRYTPIPDEIKDMVSTALEKAGRR